MEKNVSIVIPTFNRADFLSFTIDSCLNQTVPCEIIVCDHGSTDNTPLLMNNYQNKGVKYIRRDQDYGPHFCWLEGIISATYDLIHLQYDDDWIEPDFTEKCLKLFDSETGFVFTKTKIYLQNHGSYSEMFSPFGKTGYVNKKKIADFAISGNVINPACGIFRKKVLLDNLFMGKVPLSKHFYHGVGPDTLFSLMSLIEYRKVGYVDEFLATFRVHDGSITINSFKTKNTKNLKAKAYKEAHKLYVVALFEKKLKLSTVLFELYKLFFHSKIIFFRKVYFYAYKIFVQKRKYVY